MRYYRENPEEIPNHDWTAQTMKTLGRSGSEMIVAIGMTPEVQEVLKGSRKWLMRIHERKAELPPGFMDGCDPKPLADKIRDLLDGPISRRHENGQLPNASPSATPKPEGQHGS